MHRRQFPCGQSRKHSSRSENRVTDGERRTRNNSVPAPETQTGLGFRGSRKDPLFMSMHISIGGTDSSGSRPFTALSKFPRQVSGFGNLRHSVRPESDSPRSYSDRIIGTHYRRQGSKRGPQVRKGTFHNRRHILHPKARGSITGRASDVRWVNGNREQGLNP